MQKNYRAILMKAAVGLLAFMLPFFAKAQSYCTPMYSTGCIYGDDILEFKFFGETDSIHYEKLDDCPSAAYLDLRDSMSASVVSGKLYSGSITSDYESEKEWASLWVDWNEDGVFSSDERVVFSIGPFGGFVTTTLIPLAAEFSFIIPAYISPGPKTMRIRTAYNTVPDDPCASFSYGETHDYTLNVIELDPCTGSTDGGIATASADSGPPGGIFTLTADLISYAAGMDYQWQFSSDGISAWTDIPGAYTSVYWATAPFVSGTYFYRYRSVCTATSDTAYSTQVAYTVDSLVCTDYVADAFNASIIFQVHNTNSYPISINGIKTMLTAPGVVESRLLFRPMPVYSYGSSWTAGAIEDGLNGWILAGNEISTVPPHSEPVYLMNELELYVPAGATYTFCLTMVSGAYIRFSKLELGGGVNIFNYEGVQILTGDNISWAGPLSYSSMGMMPDAYPRGFVGCVLFSEAVECSPVATIDISLDNPECGDVHLSATADISGCSYSWNGPLDFSTTDSAFSLINPNIEATGWYYVTVISPGGCLTIDSVFVQAYPQTGYVQLNVLDTLICPESEVKISASCDLISGVTYEWFPSGGAVSGLYNQHYTVSPETTFSQFTARAITTEGCSSINGDTSFITTDPMPSEITFTNPTSFGAADGTFTLWDLISGAVYQISFQKESTVYLDSIKTATPEGTLTVYALGAGVYTHIKVQNQETECYSNNVFTVTLRDPPPSNIEEMNSEYFLRVFPNPVEDLIVIQLKEFHYDARILITDVQGRLLKAIDQITELELKIDMSAYPSGMYIIQYQFDNHEEMLKVNKR